MRASTARRPGQATTRSQEVCGSPLRRAPPRLDDMRRGRSGRGTPSCLKRPAPRRGPRVEGPLPWSVWGVLPGPRPFVREGVLSLRRAERGLYPGRWRVSPLGSVTLLPWASEVCVKGMGNSFPGKYMHTFFGVSKETSCSETVKEGPFWPPVLAKGRSRVGWRKSELSRVRFVERSGEGFSNFAHRGKPKWKTRTSPLNRQVSY